MKKTLLVIASLLVLCASAFAQEKETFYPGWQYGIQIGATYTAGEASFKDLLSVPAIGLTAGYQFAPWFTLRGDITGFQAKGALPAYSATYKWNYAQLSVNGTFDICNMFKFKSTRTVNPYLLVGFGGNLRFNNAEAAALETAHPEYKYDYLWTNPALSFAGRFGGGIEFRCSDAIRLTLEVTDDMLSDKFNSKKGYEGADFDWNINGLIGIKFTFGQAKKKAAAIAAAKAAAEAQAAAEAAAKAAAEKAAAEKAAAEKAAKEAAERAAREAAEKAAAEKAAAEAAAKAAKEAAWNNAKADPARNIFFTIGKSYVNSTEAKKIKNLAKLLNENPDMVAEIVGAADSATGSAAINWTLSEKRAAAVKAALIKAGVPENRISSRFIGGTMEFSNVAAKNRVAIMVTE